MRLRSPFLIYFTCIVEFWLVSSLMGAARLQTPRCFQVLDFIFTSTWKLHFYLELTRYCYVLISKRSIILFCSAFPVVQHEHLEELVWVHSGICFHASWRMRFYLGLKSCRWDVSVAVYITWSALMMIQNYHKYFP